MNQDLPTTLKNVIYYVVEEENSQDIYDIISELSVDDDNGEFTDRYDLGEWFYEALESSDLSVITILDTLASDKLREEHDAAIDLKMIVDAQQGEY